MTISKAPSDKMMQPLETKMPTTPKEQRENICSVTGHLFTKAIKKMIVSKSPDLPEQALCSRCGNKINLKEL